MKPYLPFAILSLVSVTFFISKHILENKNSYNKLCAEDVFFVTLPENCQLCPHKKAKYIDWYGKSIWACIPSFLENEEEISFILPDFKEKNCSGNNPLKDILGNCHSCDTPYSFQIDENNIHLCQGKRFLTEYRRTFKSQVCLQLSQIQNPEICLNCRGKWIDEKCVRWTLKEMNLCKKNADCPKEQWCQPIYHTEKYQGICRLISDQNWICSDLEGYNADMASIFCERQNAHIPTELELNREKEAVLSSCSRTNIWAIFDEGRIYLDSMKSPFIITDERNSILSGGDNTYALCRKN